MVVVEVNGYIIKPRAIGLASRRKRHSDTIPTIYNRESPRQEGTNDGEMWDSLTDAAGVMPPAHAKAIEAAAEQLEVELMSGRTDQAKKPRGNSFDSGLAGGNMNQHETWEEAFAGVSGDEGIRDAMIASGHITDGVLPR